MIPASDGNCRLPGPATRQLFQVATLPLSSPKGTMRLEVEPKMASSKSAPQKRKDAFGGLSEVSRREEICRLPAVVQCCRFSIPSFHRGLAKAAVQLRQRSVRSGSRRYLPNSTPNPQETNFFRSQLFGARTR
jgi:hypothetical protein